MHENPSFCAVIIVQLDFSRGKYQYEVKWYIPLSDLELSDNMDDTPVEWKQKIEKAEKEIKVMKSKVKELKAQLRKEYKECKDVSKVDLSKIVWYESRLPINSLESNIAFILSYYELWTAFYRFFSDNCN